MTLTILPGCDGFPFPFYWGQDFDAANALNNNLLIDATGEKAAFIGRVSTPNYGAKSIEFIGFRFGTVTKAGGSGLTVSLQDVSSASLVQPDETQDQTVAIANGDSSFASNTWITTGSLSANRSVTQGDLLAVVVEYDGSGRLGSDSVAISGNNNLTGFGSAQCYCSLKRSGSWAVVAGAPIVALGFSDGTWGTLYGASISSAVGQIDFNSSSSPDEYAIEFSLPVPCKVSGWWMGINRISTSGDFDVILYDGTTPMTGGSMSVDATTWGNGSFIGWAPFSQEVQLAASTTYRLAIKPTTTNSVRIYYFDVSAAAIMQALPGGTSFVLGTRTDAASWDAATTTRRLFGGLIVSSVDDGAGGSGSSGGLAAGLALSV